MAKVIKERRIERIKDETVKRNERRLKEGMRMRETEK